MGRQRIRFCVATRNILIDDDAKTAFTQIRPEINVTNNKTRMFKNSEQVATLRYTENTKNNVITGAARWTCRAGAFPNREKLESVAPSRNFISETVVTFKMRIRCAATEMESRQLQVVVGKIKCFDNGWLESR